MILSFVLPVIHVRENHKDNWDWTIHWNRKRWAQVKNKTKQNKEQSKKQNKKQSKKQKENKQNRKLKDRSIKPEVNLTTQVMWTNITSSGHSSCYLHGDALNKMLDVGLVALNTITIDTVNWPSVHCSSFLLNKLLQKLKSWKCSERLAESFLNKHATYPLILGSVFGIELV